MSVLVLAADHDPTADQVVRALDERGTPVDRIDTAWFPGRLGFHAELTGGRWTGQLSTPERVVELDDVQAVFYRSPQTFQFPDEMSPVERQHALTETKLGLGGVLSSLDLLWVNHPNRVADASYKPVQLVLAQRCGLAVANTLITSEATAVRRFAAGPDTPVVTKMLGAALIGEEGVRKAAYTRRVTREDLDDLRGIDMAAHQFQHWVPKACDARVVVVGERMFAFAIHALSAEAHLDFRRDYGSLRYERVELPEDVERGLR